MNIQTLPAEADQRCHECYLLPGKPPDTDCSGAEHTVPKRPT